VIDDEQGEYVHSPFENHYAITSNTMSFILAAPILARLPLNVTSALFRLLVSRLVEIKHTRHVGNDSKQTS